MMLLKPYMPPSPPTCEPLVIVWLDCHSPFSCLSWSECSGLVDYSRVDLLTPVIPLYQKFFEENKIRILVYSGDVDGVVPHTGEW